MSNYIVYFETADKSERDFERFKNVSREKLHEQLRELASHPLWRKYKFYHIWQADKDCYETAGNMPVESGGLDSLRKEQA